MRAGSQADTFITVPRTTPEVEVTAAWSGGSSNTSTFGRGEKIFVGHVFKYAIFDIKPTYDHYKISS